ncbi:MAG: cell division protein SepF [Armatimonadota bacterium]|nr:cell division protein SepF [Armatimonadota bacterium]MDR7428349.1 cell division protein SepF [Armatimonadota bacterium]MDR7464912.1 cell division protein SepF [Armatimonadota bacterium]MDR7470324.1 cell division protein SepF [Armatimonadota bacterium]MDR7475282.1 cell division protein SepF [Armatimonadota bacterium]
MEKFMTFLGLSEEVDDEDAQGAQAAPARRSPVFSLHAQRQWEIVVIDPRSLDDARRGADFVKARRPVFVNLQGVEAEVARRIVDFLSGATYALDGHLQRVGEEMFLFTPSNVLITTELTPPERAALFPIE